METYLTDAILSHYREELANAKQLLTNASAIKIGKKPFEDVNTCISFTNFSMDRVQTEVRRNILKIKDDYSLLQYFYYLLKIFYQLRSSTEISNCFTYKK